MAGLHVSDSVGNPKPVSALWVADDTGLVKPVLEGWVADSSGLPKRFWPLLPAQSVVTVASGSPSYLQNVISWSAVGGALSYQLFANGTSVYGPGPLLTYTHAVEPLTQNTYMVRVTNVSGSTDSAAVIFSTPGMPAPTSLRTTAVAYNKIDYAWNAVSGADAYELVHAANNARITLTAGLTGSLATSASTSYSVKVRAARLGVWGGFTTALNTTTPAIPGPAFGVYEYAPTAFSTWQSGTPGGSTFDDPKWRAQSDGMYYGDGSRYGSTRGVQTCFWFYDSAGIQNQLRNGRVTRLQALLYRVTGVGDYDPAKAVRWWMHKYSGATGSTPGWGTDVQGGEYHSTIDDEEYKWIDLPAGWGQQFVDGWWKGIALGNDGDLDRYMKFVRDAGHATGNLRFTIG
jgi:hypothetical protein